MYCNMYFICSGVCVCVVVSCVCRCTCVCMNLSQRLGVSHWIQSSPSWLLCHARIFLSHFLDPGITSSHLTPYVDSQDLHLHQECFACCSGIPPSNLHSSVAFLLFVSKCSLIVIEISLSCFLYEVSWKIYNMRWF